MTDYMKSNTKIILTTFVVIVFMFAILVNVNTLNNVLTFEEDATTISLN